MSNVRKPTVAIIDYSAGNLLSVQRACEHVGLNSIITSEANVLVEADAAILPGVGAFADAVARLRALDLEAPLKDFISSGRPFMGVCLGMQLLFTESEEFGQSKGLGLIPGAVRRFPATADGVKVRVPQIGWNQVAPAKSWQSTPMASLSAGAYMYFVHSFYVVSSEASSVLSKTTYAGVEYCSSVQKKNVCAFQFHPEKSGEEGIKIYREWAAQVAGNP